jgi:hypothetical protein
MPVERLLAGDTMTERTRPRASRTQVRPQTERRNERQQDLDPGAQNSKQKTNLRRDWREQESKGKNNLRGGKKNHPENGHWTSDLNAESHKHTVKMNVTK